MPGSRCVPSRPFPGNQLCFCLQIKLWDLRATKCVRHYEGHVNEYAYLPLHMHEEEGILVAGVWGLGGPIHQVLPVKALTS